jgi:glycosyltransferase involved in cell wall biosynthesis
LERGSAHIAEQAELLEKTTKKSVIDVRVIRKEIQEYEEVDYISTISSYAAKSFTEKGFSTDKIFVNNMGVDLQDFPLINRTLQTTTNEFVVGYVGAMSSQKNVKGLIFAVKKLVEQGLAIKLLLVGEIDSTTFDKQLLEQNFIVYQQAVPQAQLIEFYKKMNLFVLNSVQDGFGMVILQAMATGLAVIGTTNTGCPDVIRDEYNGFVIPIENDEILAEKIRFCYENRQKCLEMGHNARKRVEKGFSWEDYGKRYVPFLEKITKK